MAALTLLAGCMSSQEGPGFNPTPRPAKPAQVVVVAGDPKLNRGAEDGALALRTSAYGAGGVAVGKDATIYFSAPHLSGHNLARIDRGGRLRMLPLQTNATRMAIDRGLLWLMTSTKSAIYLESVPLNAISRSRPYLEAPRKNGGQPVLRDGRGHAVSTSVQREYGNWWSGAKFVLRPDGVPVMVTDNGRMLAVTGPEKVEVWKPSRFESAREILSRDSAFKMIDAANDVQGNIVVLGNTGLIYVPVEGAAVAAPFPRELIRQGGAAWSTVVLLPDARAAVLLGAADDKEAPQPMLMTRSGRLNELNWGRAHGCAPIDGTLRSVGSANPGQVARGPDGSYVLTDLSCGRLLSFRLPEGIGAGTG